MFKNKLQVFSRLIISLLVLCQFAALSPVAVSANSDFATSPVNYRLTESNYAYLPQQLSEQMLWVYVAVPWHLAEPCDTDVAGCQYNWNDPQVIATEAAIDQYIAAGKKVFITIKTSPSWAREQVCATQEACRPKQAAWNNFENFVLQLYSRHNYVFGLEVWNEPDAPATGVYFGGWADASAANNGGQWYGQFLAEIYPTLKNALPRFIYIGGLMQNDLVSSAHMSFFEGVLIAIKNKTACINAPASAYDICADGMSMHMYPYWQCFGANCNSRVDWDVLRGNQLGLGTQGLIKGKIAFNKQLLDVHCPIADCEKTFPMKVNETALIKNDYACQLPNYAQYKAAKIAFLPKLYFRSLVNLIGNTPAVAYFDFNDSWQCVGLTYGNTTEPFEAYDFLSEKLYNYSWKVKSYVFGAGSNNEVVKLRDEYQPNIEFWAVYKNVNNVVSCFTLPTAQSVTVYNIYGTVITPTVGDFCNPVLNSPKVSVGDSPIYISIVY